MSKIKTHVKKGDEVQVITGVHKDATGKILQVYPEKGHVLVEGIRMIKRHTRKSQEYPNGAIIEREGPIHISNVKKIESSQAGKSSKKTSKKEKA